MSKYVHKNGRVCNVYNTPFTDWNEPPQDEFPQTFPGIESREQLAHELNSNDFVLIDRPASKREEKPSALPLAALLAGLAAMNVPQQKIDEIQAKRTQDKPIPEVSREQLGVVNVAADLQDRILQEFRLVVAENNGDGSAEPVTNIGTFLLQVFPELEEQLKAIAKGKKRKTFSCD